MSLATRSARSCAPGGERWCGLVKHARGRDVPDDYAPARDAQRDGAEARRLEQRGGGRDDVRRRQKVPARGQGRGRQRPAGAGQRRPRARERDAARAVGRQLEQLERRRQRLEYGQERAWELKNIEVWRRSLSERCVKGQGASTALRMRGAVDRGCATQSSVLKM
jgi:hypothetical protein